MAGEIIGSASFCGLKGLLSLISTFLLIFQTYANPLEHQSPSTSTSTALCSCNTTSENQELDISNEIRQVIDVQRRIIRNSTIGYNYPHGRYNISASKFEDLAIEEGGTPIRSVILSSWRSGSSFLGQTIAALPGNYYYYEPFVDFGFVKFRSHPLATIALNRIRALLNCDFSGLQDTLLRYIMEQSWKGHSAIRDWSPCLSHNGMCFDPRYHSSMCKLFPFISMKILRLRLSIAQELLADEQKDFGKLNKPTDRQPNCHHFSCQSLALAPREDSLRHGMASSGLDEAWHLGCLSTGFLSFIRFSLSSFTFILDILHDQLGVRLILLVRDPRGTMRSRKRVAFCQKGPDCHEAVLHCADLVSDYKIAVQLQRKYPNTFRVVRYEDLVSNPHEEVEELSKFYGREFHPNVKDFLDEHTTRHINGSFDLHRDSKSTAFQWKTDMDFEEVDEIQRTCAVAMHHWGYLPAMNATHQREFNPVTNYVL